MRRLPVLLLLALLASCRSVRYVPVESVRRDTVYQLSEHRDSVYLRDSVRVEVAGDTVRLYRDRYHYRTIIRTDTLYRSVRDTVRVPVPVEARPTRWQRAKQELGGFAMGGTLLAVLLAAGWLVLRMRRK